MAIIVAPTDNYVSFLSVAGSNTFHSARGNTVWEDTDDSDKETALVRATDYILFNYAELSDYAFIGEDDVVDPLVQKATAMLALHALSEDLFAIRDEREVLEEEMEGVGRTKYRGRNGDRFPMVTKMLSSLATFTGGGVVMGKVSR